MKNILSNIMKPGKWVSSLTLFMSTYLLTQATYAQDSNNTTLGDVGNNIAQSGTGIANAINIFAIVGGAALFVIGLYFLASERHRSQKGMGGPMVMIVIGVMLLTWQYLAGTINNTTLGQSAQEQFLND